MGMAVEELLTIAICIEDTEKYFSYFCENIQ